MTRRSRAGIGQLADEERALEHSHAGEGPSADELSRLRSLEVATSLGHGSIRDLSRDDLVIRDDFGVVSSTSSPRRRPNVIGQAAAFSPPEDGHGGRRRPYGERHGRNGDEHLITTASDARVLGSTSAARG